MSLAVEEEHESVWRSVWLRGGKFTEVTWIDQDVIAWASGLHIVFFDVNNGELKLSKFIEDAIAVGVSCLSGHYSRKLFAYAERNRKPRILVYAYPSLQKIAECVKGTSYAYLATAFTGDYLVSLGSLPDFKLIVWSWRNGYKMATVDTAIYDAGYNAQCLRVNFTAPTFLAQFGIKSGQLCTWHMTVCSKTAILNPTTITLPKRARVKDAAWCPNLSFTEGQDILAITDHDGNIYLCRPNGDELRRIVNSQRRTICLEVEPTTICWHRDAIVLRSSSCQIRYYVKDASGVWNKTWSSETVDHPTVLTSYPFRDDRLFYASREGYLVQIKVSENKIDYEMNIKYFAGGRYMFLDVVHPWDEHIVAIDESMELSVIRAREGDEVTKIDLKLEGHIKVMRSHLDYPLIILCSDVGEVIFVSFLQYHKPMVLGKYRIQLEALDLMKFSSSGRYLIIAQKEKGICYLLNVWYTQKIEILSQLDTNMKIVDVISFDIQNILHLYVLEQSLKGIPVGNKLYIYKLSKNNELINTHVVIRFKTFFKSMHYMFGETNTFVSTSYCTKQLKFFKISDDNNITVFHMKATGHTVRQSKTFTFKRWMVTSGFGGLIVVRRSKLRSSFSIHLTSHHQQESGTAKAIIHDAGDLLVALGGNGSIIALKYFNVESLHGVVETLKNLWEFGRVNFEDDDGNVTKYLSGYDSQLKDFLSNPSHAVVNYELTDNSTWVAWLEQQRIDEERRQSLIEKDKILLKFNVIKSRVVELLNQNENIVEQDRLPISAFDLNKALRDQRIKAAKNERVEMRQKIQTELQEKGRVADLIQSNFWAPQQVLAQSIYGIFDEMEVTNYTICYEKTDSPEFLKFALFLRNITKDITSSDTFDLWEDYTSLELKAIVEKQLKVKKKLDKIEEVEKLITDEELEIKEEEKRNKQLLEGFTTHYFIEPSVHYYSQFQLYAFPQVISDNRYLSIDSKRLRLHFNKLFDEMKSIKDREMSLVRERIDRILYISNELWQMFQEVVGQTFEYPEWKTKEKPETIIRLTDAEISAKLYVSPSEQELYNKQAAEEERQRLALLADDFRPRTLQRMMDGVLEVKWEDLIKRDPEPPECINLGKKVQEYTDEELLAVNRYETELRNLESDRAKYRKILQSDFMKTSDALAEGIDRFNSRLADLHLVKLKIEAAIQQLNLRYARHQVRHINKLNDLKADVEIRQKIGEKQKLISIITEDIKVIQSIEQELRVQYDAVNTKDKFVEKKLKTEFPTLGKSAFTAITLQFKRRPRAVLKTTSANEVLDLGKSILSMHKLPYLTPECLEYIKHLEILDIRPPTLPNSVDEIHWQNLVVLRRIKIEHELHQRAIWLDLESTTNTLAMNYCLLSQNKLESESLADYLAQSRVDRVNNELDLDVQLVLKLGQTELDATMRGDVYHDASEALLITRTEIERINAVIKKAGSKKLRTMQKSLDFRRSIAEEIWENDVVNTKLKHLQSVLYYVKLANVTREMKKVLNRWKVGGKEDKTPHKMEKNFLATRTNYEKILNEWKTKLQDIGMEISRIQQKNKKMHQTITNMNVERCDMELKRDIESELRQTDHRARVMKLIAERSAVVRKLLANYEEMSEARGVLDNLACNRGLPIKFPSDTQIHEE